MLNYIWLALIVIGIFVAVGRDVSDLATDKYKNNTELPVLIQLTDSVRPPFTVGKSYKCTLQIQRVDYEKAYSSYAGILDVITQRGEFITSSGQAGSVHIVIDEASPPMLKEIFKAQRNNDYLLAHLQFENSFPVARMKIDPVKFVNVNAVTNDGIIKYSKIAVELALGLIGIMALWLGIMKVAEDAGLVSKLASLLKPVMTRLFPDVPADHPAMGAMIMNISANMLGLANAATPLGLKAMEELNKLNKKLGTATDAMCTFLVINTGNVQLIPATVIAIRASVGSANPTEILGPVIIATLVTVTFGVFTVKLLAKLAMYKKQLED